jgi:hypothetical protein
MMAKRFTHALGPRYCPHENKNGCQGSRFVAPEPKRLLQLRFFVQHMLACFGIEFHDLHFVRHGFFVLAGGVEMTRACSRFEFDFVAHDGFLWLEMLASG